METETRETNNNYYPEGMGPWGWNRQAPSTGVVGTILGAIGTVGVIAGALGLANRNQNGGDSGDKHVTRYELGLVQENNALRATVAKLEAQIYTDAKFEAVNTTVMATTAAQQRVNDNIMAMIGTLNTQAAQFAGMTQTILSPRALGPSEAVLASVKAAAPAATTTTTASNG